MRVIEAALFLSLATGVHLGFWAASPQPQGATAAGDQGTDRISVSAASASQAALVNGWTRPPDVAPAPLPVAQAPAPHQAAPPPAPVGDTPARLRPMPAIAAPTAPSLPRIDTATAAPRPAPTEVARPRPRPDRQTATAAKTPAPSQAAAAHRTARGKARSEVSGSGGNNASQALSPAQTNALRATWGADIYARVRRNMTYPRGSRDSGTTRLALTVARNGRLEGAQVVTSSGSAALDRAALRAVTQAGRFAGAPAGLTQASYSFSLALTFTR